MHVIIAVILTGGLCLLAAQHEHASPSRGAGGPQIPQSLRAEHEELHAELAALVRLGGKTGAAAEAVSRALKPHFEGEEEYALPPLGLLKPLAEGASTSTPEMHTAGEMSARLKTNLPKMLEEHKEIVKTLDALSAAAMGEKQSAGVEFAKKLKLHAQTEEEVLYPSSILIGEYLKLKTGH